MKERVILAVKFTPAGSAGQVRKAVGGFLRYIQHRDLHLTQTGARSDQMVSGLLKYVAYRDRATAQAELLGPSGTLSSAERKAFAAFVSGALENSPPHLYLCRDGELQDRRRAVYRMVISPEDARGLDLSRLTTASVAALERKSGIRGLRWIAAIHRNTCHHHVHLVLAGMAEDGVGGYRRVDLTKPRLAAIKEAVAQEIERQRGERTPARPMPKPFATEVRNRDWTPAPTLNVVPVRPVVVQKLSIALPARRLLSVGGRADSWWRTPASGSLAVLRAVARRYSHQMERELEEEARHSGREHAA